MNYFVFEFEVFRLRVLSGSFSSLMASFTNCVLRHVSVFDWTRSANVRWRDQRCTLSVCGEKAKKGEEEKILPSFQLYAINSKCDISLRSSAPGRIFCLLLCKCHRVDDVVLPPLWY